MHKSYTELSKIKDYKERIKYLMTNNPVGDSTFGYKRIMNQQFYTSQAWRKKRKEIICRDNGMDLGLKEMNPKDIVMVHHINPITDKDIEDNSPLLLDSDNLITVSKATHEIITYNDEKQLDNKMSLIGERYPNDTIPWK